MRLKRLELKGFKSFANDTVIHFSEDVTGVVGPNGSGKSNIVDAVRWVLGEQSSKDLRLESMSDIIFNGTKNRRKSPYARATIVFNNDNGLLPSEYTDVEISRTLDQSGTSEYMLNGVKCRLKDIKSLLMDTGIGSSSYAIIALGMVDDILNDTNDARRKMFEQAAGISKYKRRKHQSMLKLKSTNADLERIEDLLHEINLNLRSLKRQATRAAKYLKVKKDYREQSIILASAKSQKLNEKYKKIQSSIEAERDKISTLKTEIKKGELESEERKNKNVKKEADVSTAQKTLSKLMNDIRSTESDRSMAQQKVEFAERQLNDLNKREEKIHQQIESTENKIESLDNHIAEEQVKVDELRQSKDKLKDKKDSVEERLNDVGTDRSVHLSYQQKIEKNQLNLEKEISILESRIEDVKYRDSESERKITQLKEEIEKTEKKHSEEIKKIDKLEKKAALIGEKEEVRLHKLEETENKIQEKGDELQEVNRKLDAFRNEYKLIKNLVEKLEGFPDSIKFLNKHKKWGNNARLFSDILYCEEKYRSAIENYLEPYLSYYVVPNRSKAFKAIALLKGAQKGKAQFFINSTFVLPEEETETIKSMKRAIDIVEVDEQFNPLMSTLLHDVYVIDSVDKVDAYSREHPSKVLLSRDGTIVKRINRISGGSAGLFEGKRIGRKKNLEKLQSRIKQLTSTQSSLESDISQLNEEKELLKSEDASRDMKQLRNTLDQAYRESQQSAIKIENLRENIGDLKKSQGDSSRKQDTYLENKAELKKDLRKLTDELKNAGKKMDDIEGAYAEVNKKASMLSEQFNEINIRLIKQEGMVERHTQELKNNKKQLQNAVENLEEVEEERSQRKKAKSYNLAQISELEENLEKQLDRKKVIESDLNAVESIFFKEREKIQNIDKELKSKQKILQQHQHLLSEYKDSLSEMKIDLNSMAERLKVEFEVSMDAIFNRKLEEDIDIDALSENVNKLKNKKQKFSEVNPMAVEAFEEMKERYEMIKQQKQDIIDAKESLEDTITEIENRATDRFMNSFEEVRDYFIQVFRTLFRNEDNCDLILKDPDNPLETDIEILARPKGKKPKSLSQLSGGEKTLTATALLFALYLLKPAPFCIFDEVDAPLDDVNIDKFNNIINKFSSQSQFIIVTHNKMTMASVDVIYGVYMDEPGISGVSAVDFRHYEDSGLVISDR